MMIFHPTADSFFTGIYRQTISKLLNRIAACVPEHGHDASRPASAHHSSPSLWSNSGTTSLPRYSPCVEATPPTL